jgi:hypothetical protein
MTGAVEDQLQVPGARIPYTDEVLDVGPSSAGTFGAIDREVLGTVAILRDSFSHIEAAHIQGAYSPENAPGLAIWGLDDRGHPANSDADLPVVQTPDCRGLCARASDRHLLGIHI